MRKFSESSTYRPQPCWRVLLAALLLSVWGCDPAQKSPGARASARPAEAPRADGFLAFNATEKRLIARLSPLKPPPADETNAVVQDPRAAHLGQFLFFDTRLSANQAVSCATCHRPDHGFAAPTRLGHGIATTPRHPPSLLNVAYYPWFDWDGRVDSIWSQAFGPLESPLEMGFSRTELVHLAAEDAELKTAYEAIFGTMPDLQDPARFPRRARPVPDDPSHPDAVAWAAMRPQDRDTVNRVASNLTKSIAAYVAGLVQKDAPFDTFAAQLLEKPDAAAPPAISPEAQRGLKLFLGKAGCVRCHVGPNFSDGSFHNLGLAPRDWLESAENPDRGRWVGVVKVQKNPFNAKGPYSDAPGGERAQWLHYLTQTREDHGQFKTPTLRNIALTPPYMHGGHFETLEEVVRFYSVLNEQSPVGHREDMLVPLGLSQAEIKAVVAFLHTLTGEPLPEEALHPPASPIFVRPAEASLP